MLPIRDALKVQIHKTLKVKDKNICIMQIGNIRKNVHIKIRKTSISRQKVFPEIEVQFHNNK